MNRSILIVICDFLLVSLLAFSTVDLNRVSEEGTAPQARVDIATNHVDSGQDLTAVMRMALQEERQNRDQLLGELTRTRSSLAEREALVQTAQRQFAAAQTNIQNLNKRLESSSTEAVISKEQLSAMEAELRRRKEEAAALEQQLSQLSRSNQVVLSEKQQLAGQLQVAEVERRHATEQATRMEEQVKIEREEKAKLAEGVHALASKSGALVEEIRENRPLAPNAIFSEFATNRVQARFHAYRSGLFDVNKNKETETVLVTDGTNTFALCHVEDTPLTLWSSGKDWEQLSGTLDRNSAQVPIHSVSFHLQDTRVVFMPVSPVEAGRLGGKVYRVSSDPYKFQDAVLVGAREGYYGECKFEIDLSTPGYVKLDRNVLKGLFGKFNPSRGDLVFSKNGEILGVMANSTYCLTLSRFVPSATIRFDQSVRDQQTGGTLSYLYSVVSQMPPRLQ